MEKKVLDSMSFNFSNSIRYLYGADGVKRRVRYRTVQSGGIVPFSFTGNQIQASGLPGIDPPLPPVTTVTTMDYSGNAIYENNVLTTLLVEGGYVSFTKTGTGASAVYTPTYHFYMRDHLGSIRVVASTAGTAEQVSHYYPYGSTFYGELVSDHRFKYCGKELDKMHGLDWYDSSARYYDHVLGRFHQMDPLAEKYYSWSPYAYCHDDPVNKNDPTGMDDFFNQFGHFLYSTNEGDNIFISTIAGNTLLSEFDYRFLSNIMMIQNVARHYISLNDKNDFYVGFYFLPYGKTDYALNWDVEKKIYEVDITSDGHIHHILNNKYDFISIAFHETRHRYFKKTHGGDIGEVEAVIMQTSDPSWNNTSDEYKESQALYAKKRFNLAIKNKHVSPEQYKEYEKRLNKGFYGYWEFFVENNQMEIMPASNYKKR